MVEYTLDDVREIIDIEGFEYALVHYISPDNISDGKLSGLVEDFSRLHSRIEEVINDSEDEEMDELKGTVENEGLDYALTDYVNIGDLPDADLADQVKDYLALRVKIVEHLGLK